MTALMLSLALLAQQSDSIAIQNSDLELGLFFHSGASADLRQGLSTLNADTILAFPSGAFERDWARIKTVTSVSYTPDSTSFAIEPVSAEAYFRWPGSPWVATGVSIGEIDPFISGLGTPVKEWNSYGVLDSTVVSLEAGGLLGFEGSWNQFGDSLSWYGLSSPWLGFGMVNWNRIRVNSSELESFSGFLDLRKVQPWFVFVKENSEWTYLAEIRDWKPLRNRSFSVEVVPGFSYEKDSTLIGLTGYLRGNNRAISASLEAVMDVENGTNPNFSGGMDIISQAGIAWSLDAFLEDLEYFHSEVSAFYRMSPAGCGANLEIFDDSLRATATALYSPVPGISTELSVMSNLSNDSPEPGCLISIFGAKENITSALTLEWEKGHTTLRMEVSAWID